VILQRPEGVRTSPGSLRYRQTFLVILAVGISVLFFLVIRRFLLAMLLAAVFAGVATPLFDWFRTRTGPRRAGALTLAILLLAVGLPVTGFLTLVAKEAVQLSQGAEVWFHEAERMSQFYAVVARIPFAEVFIPDPGSVLENVRDAAGRTGPLLMGVAAAATRGTLSALLQIFVLFYALFFFLVDGRMILKRFLDHVPLTPTQKGQLLDRFVSVTRATLRGSLLIGLIQGGLAGLAFWVVGVPGSAFWATMMVILSIIPAIGAGLIWVPAVIYLFMVGETVAGVGLLIWCAVVVSSIDNLLRPRLIGRDARMSDLLILVSTLGGILLFGAVGFIVGPIVAALFVAVWHMYGEATQSWLPEGNDTIRLATRST
jgi:predicted PurR-regulated permease PerM